MSSCRQDVFCSTRGHSSWKDRPKSKRRKFMKAMALEDMLDREKLGRLQECYHFFADFWESTPHPVAQMILVLGWAVTVAIVNDTRVLGAGFELDDSAGKTLTTIVAFLIVFRTNQSYNRWWEGRILWGRMHWSCVELSQEAASWIQDVHLAKRIMNFAIAYSYTVKQCLRREALLAEDLDGIIDPAEVARMNRLSSAVMPYYCTDVIRQCIKKGLTEKPQAFGVQAVARGIDIPVSQLSVQYADMARVRNTPQPEVFRVMLHMFTIVYLLLLPVISYEVMGYWIIPEVFVTAYLMLGLQLAAKDLEDPFGYDLSDLDLNLYVSNVANQCRAAFYLGEKGDVDLTLEDGGAGRDQKEKRATEFDQSTDRTDSNNNSQPESLSSQMNTFVSPGSTPDGGEATCDYGVHSPQVGSKSREEIAPAASFELVHHKPVHGSSMERGRSMRSRNGSEEPIPDPRERPGEQSGNNSIRAPRLRVVSIHDRAQEEKAPRRRSKSRPGRGQSPLVKESFTSPQLDVQQYSFEHREAAGHVDVV